MKPLTSLMGVVVYFGGGGEVRDAIRRIIDR